MPVEGIEDFADSPRRPAGGEGCSDLLVPEVQQDDLCPKRKRAGGEGQGSGVKRKHQMYPSKESIDGFLKPVKLHFEGDVKRTKTYHEGANDERTAVLAKVRRMVKGKPDGVDSVYINGTELVKWLLQRNGRYKKNPGGL